MEDQTAEQAKAVQDALNEVMERAGAFEAMVTTKGWEYIQAYYQNKVQGLASSILLQDSKPMEDFENERRELIGLKKLLNFIDNDLTTLANERVKQSKAAVATEQ